MWYLLRGCRGQRAWTQEPTALGGKPGSVSQAVGAQASYFMSLSFNLLIYKIIIVTTSSDFVRVK